MKQFGILKAFIYFVSVVYNYNLYSNHNCITGYSQTVSEVKKQ